LFGLFFEYVNINNNSWTFPREHEFVPFKIFGVVTIEAYLWYFLWVAIIIAYYEYFLDTPTTSTFVKRLKRAKRPLIGLFVLVLLFKLTPLDFNFSYTYSLSALLAFVPLYFLYKRNLSVLKRILYTIPFFTFFFGSMEYVALVKRYWDFTGTYLFAIPFGHTQIPIEEIIAWIILSSVVIATYHELWTDDTL